MKGVTVCESKKFYDTEWEAILAANRAEHRFNEEMEPYQCRTHWHITHKNPKQRRGAGFRHTKCERCHIIVRSAKMSKHKCKKVNP